MGKRNPYLELSLSRKAPFLNITLQTMDRVLSRAHALDLLTSTVGSSGIRHPKIQLACDLKSRIYTIENRGKLKYERNVRVSSVAVRHELKEQGSLPVDGPLFRELHSLVNRDDIHTVGLDTWDLVTASEVLCVRR